ncbi:nicotinamide N-methyltransferase-like [Dendropsophus ebraccatus]|uniref:nicotinamide N-methyltransferase-like n=1 Tax=Dendropsophus ebraccatus TaxID=150705 RepID=UPI0038322EA6
MALCTEKSYPEHGHDPRKLLEDYFSDGKAFSEDSLKFPIANLTRLFSKGDIKGDLLLDLSVGPFSHLFYTASEYFKEIVILKVKDRCILEQKKWLNSGTGAFDWGHTAKFQIEMDGSSEDFKNKELKVKAAIKHVVNVNFGKENITAPIVLPPADAIISAWLLGGISKDEEDFVKILRKISNLLRVGGRVVLLGSLGTTYYTVGNDKFRTFSYDEDFLKKALTDCGFVIEECVVSDRTAESDLIDYTAMIFTVACKKK